MADKEQKLFMREFFRKAGKAIYDYGLIESGDKILVGVSGGKDSLALLEVLALRSRDKKHNYKVVAAHIAVQDVAYEVDEAYVRQLCGQLGVEVCASHYRCGGEGRFRQTGLFCLLLEPAEDFVRDSQRAGMQ